MKIFFRLILLFLFSLSFGKGIYFLRDGFSPRRLANLHPLETTTVTEETKKILSQPFRFLGRGRQCFAFASLDGKYVLKCPRTDIYKIPFWAQVLPVKGYRERCEADKAYRHGFVFNSFRIAQEKLQSETGIIAIHLGKSEPTSQQITLIDSLEIKHRVPLQTTIFILQHKRPLWTPAFLAAKKNQDIKEQKRLLNAFIDVIIQRAKKGVLNRDRSFLRNYGFDGVRAYQIDVGDFFQLKDWDQSYVYQKAVRDSLAPVQQWLAETDPPMLELIDARLKAL
jgi:hypothetical protein